MAMAFGKRKSIRDQIDRIDTLDEEGKRHERYQLISKLKSDVAAAKDFRWHAPATQSRQDYHLSLYNDFVFKVLDPVDEEGMLDDRKWKLLFPSDTDKLAEQYSLFISFAFQNAMPRAKAAGTATIHIRTLCQYRDSLLFWGKWYYEQRKEDFPYRKIFNEMVQTMLYVQHTYGDPLRKKEKPWLGLAELRQLLDYEATNNRCIELSEQHQVLWCIGRVTALRPGSLCPSARYSRTQPLVWRDFTFTQGAKPGMFNCRLTLDHIDIKHSQDTVTASSSPLEHPLVINLPSPEPQNIVFSPAHRLLVIALRRNVLDGIATLEDLLGSDLHNIRVSEAHLGDTVFLAGTPKGEAVDPKRPMKVHGMTDYLQGRGKLMGYTTKITWYAIRRRAATDMARRIGLNATRIFLGHTADSQTLERYYLNVAETLDSMGVLTDQPVEAGGHSDKQAREWAPLALGKLDNEGLQRTRGQALSQMTRRVILADPTGPEADTPAALKNYRRRARRYAAQVLIEEENKWQQGRITTATMQQRIGALEASKFADEVVSHALDSMSSSPNRDWMNVGLDADVAELDKADDEDGALFVGDEEDVNLDPEEALEATLGKEIQFDVDGALTLSVDTEIDAEDPRSKRLGEIEYVHLARSAMQLLLDNTMSRHLPWSRQDRRCLVCQDDDTVTDEQQAHEYTNADKLDAHLTGHFHHPVTKWRRKVETETKDENGQFQCPYCTSAGLADVPGFKTFRKMMKHMFESSPTSSSDEHDMLKAEDGWYDEDFADALNLGSTERSTQLKSAAGTKKLIESGIIDTTPYRQLLVPEPYQHSDNIVRGSYPPAPLSARYQQFLQTGAAAAAIARDEDLIPAHLEGFITRGYMETPTNPLPLYMRNDVLVTARPRSQEEDTEMEG
ncbi:hypothetical protein LTR08_004792 [Meristemomyces frigidus]|nr:hypothetical protein LTR08_004792 [Meristemomyces frigidus]